MPVQHLNPPDLIQNPAFTQAIIVTGNAKTIYIGGQNAMDAQGNIIGKGDLGAQSERAFANLQTLLQAAGADLGHIVKWTIYVVQGHDFHPGFMAFQRIWGNRPNPPTITVVSVARLAHPDALVEIDGIAVVPE